MAATDAGPAPLCCVHEDGDLLVLDKPAGWLCVPGRGPLKQDALSTRAQQRWPDALIVHRLDQATSGLVLMARSPGMQRLLSIAFARREVVKHYEAVVHGLPHAQAGADGDGIARRAEHLREADAGDGIGAPCTEETRGKSDSVYLHARASWAGIGARILHYRMFAGETVRAQPIVPSARMRARAWISFWESTPVAGRTRSMIERTNGRIAGLVSMHGISPSCASRS